MISSKTPSLAPRQGNTLPRVNGDKSPRLPHEHDESSDSQHEAQPQEVMQQAHKDVRRGLVDTDRSKQMDEVYNRTLKSGKAPKNKTKPAL
jgi:hypothetical protein